MNDHTDLRWAAERITCVARAQIACGVPFHREQAGPGGESFRLLPYDTQTDNRVQAAEALLRSKYDVVRVDVKRIHPSAIDAIDRPYRVLLANRGNPDHGQDPDAPVYGTPADHFISADSLEQAAVKVREYIDENDLGGGNWVGGDVFLRGQRQGRISYNGRFWPQDHEYAKPCVEFANAMSGQALQAKPPAQLLSTGADLDTLTVNPHTPLSAFTDIAGWRTRSPEQWRAWFAEEVERVGGKLGMLVGRPQLAPIPVLVDDDGQVREIGHASAAHAIGAAFTAGDAVVPVAAFIELTYGAKP